MKDRQDSITHVPNHVPLKGCSRTAPNHNTRAVTVGRSSIGLEDWKQTLPNAVASGARKLLDSCLGVAEAGVCAICSLLQCCGVDGKETALICWRNSLGTRVCASGVPRNFVRGCSTNSVEDRGQRERGSGCGSPLVVGSGGSCNLVQDISFHIVKFS